MNRITTIRKLLGISQAALAAELGCTQKTVSLYEHGMSFSSKAAAELIKFAASKGLMLSYDHIYGQAPLPRKEDAVGKEGSHA